MQQRKYISAPVHLLSKTRLRSGSGLCNTNNNETGAFDFLPVDRSLIRIHIEHLTSNLFEQRAILYAHFPFNNCTFDKTNNKKQLQWRREPRTYSRNGESCS